MKGSRAFGLEGLYPSAKRAIDVAAAAALLVLLIVPMAVTAAIVGWKIGRPILFVQQRPGRDGRPFNVLKFRTMSDARDAEGHLLPDGERLGACGMWLRRWSLDELPQLINVLRGDMSFIGPRPLLMSYLPLYNDEQRRRMTVRPGITGWAQVRGRNSATWEQRFHDDVFYVDHLGLALDLRIAVLTVRKVISGDGVTAADHATVAPFMGNLLSPPVCPPAATSVDIAADVCEARGNSPL